MGMRRMCSGLRSVPLVVSGSLALLAACAGKPTPPPAVTPVPIGQTIQAPTQVAPTPALDPRARLHKILELLDGGQRDQARADAQELVRQEPDDALAKSLLSQIDADPKVLLGEQSFPYKIRPGETLSILAERFLGDKYLFYALARYNGIDAPRTAEVGRTIMVPGVARELAPPPPPRRRPDVVPPRRATAPAPPPPPAPPVAAPVRNVARASALRREALVLMNKGQIDGAVGLLRQAAALDPGDSAISGDLARAVRLQAATRR